MREILFRKWHKGNNAFEYLTLADFVKNGWQICEAARSCNHLKPDALNPWATDSAVVDEWLSTAFTCTDGWEQYTGLCDKNGNKIFEGDILSLFEKGDIKATVKWNAETASFYLDDFVTQSDHLYGCFLAEVIGNIHELVTP